MRIIILVELKFKLCSGVFRLQKTNNYNYRKVPVSGKVLGKEEILNAVEACLDGWFTGEGLTMSLKKCDHFLI